MKTLKICDAKNALPNWLKGASNNQINKIFHDFKRWYVDYKTSRKRLIDGHWRTDLGCRSFWTREEARKFYKKYN